MISKASRVFQRYCDHHYTVYGPKMPILDIEGQKLGQIERLCFGQSSVRIEGWCLADKVALGGAGHIIWQRPDILRHDVAAALDIPEDRPTGFNLVACGGARHLVLGLKLGGATHQLILPQVGRAHRLRAGLHIRASFLRDVTLAAPSLLRALGSPTVVNRSAAKRALRLHVPHHQHVLDPYVLRAGRARQTSEAVTLVMPVYNAFDLLQQALQRIAAHTDLTWRMVLVEDCSTDPRVRPFVQAWAREQRGAGSDVQIIENTQNLGFIGSVNKAFKRALTYDDHVVLLNSDALVPENWASRLLHPFARDPKVASVTPLSNDAELFTAPVMCRKGDLALGVADRIDKHLAQAIHPDAYRAAPTGVGFCMAINHRFLRRIPQFDSAFGKGYGEEVDWCQRIRALGGIHVCQPSVFVEHAGGASFGTAVKQRAIANSNQLISKRYPDYDREVQHFIGKDPVRTARLFAACAQLSATSDAVRVYIAHSLGGGAELYLADTLRALTDQGGGAIVLRVGGAHRWRIEVHGPQGAIHGEVDTFSIVQKLLSPLRKVDVIYSCAVGDRRPLEVLENTLSLLDQRNASLTTLIHDYFAISPSYCLLGATGKYAGVPHLSTSDPAHNATDANSGNISLKDWQVAWGKFIARSSKVRCFSQSSADIIGQVYPAATCRIEVLPHKTVAIPRVAPPNPDRDVSIGILGDIGVQKGAQVVRDLARVLPNSGLAQLTIIGRVDPRYPLGANCTETGGYQRADIAPLAGRHRVACWLIPSIWPETFSYTTHEALATGLPVFCFDLGAQAEAARGAPNGHILPLAWQDDVARILAHIQKVVTHGAVCKRVDRSPKGRWNRDFAA